MSRRLLRLRREDRDVSKAALQDLKRRMKELRIPVVLDGVSAVVHVVKVPKCAGTATLVFSRGKCKPGFEVELKVKWHIVRADAAAAAAATAAAAAAAAAGDDDDADSAPAASAAAAAPLARGSATWAEVADYNGSDHAWEVAAEGAAADAARRVVARAKAAFDGALAAWVEGLKALV
jgi:hypothetical protein